VPDAGALAAAEALVDVLALQLELKLAEADAERALVHVCVPVAAPVGFAAALGACDAVEAPLLFAEPLAVGVHAADVDA